jgi:tRNA/rRNA methyltransferase
MPDPVEDGGDRSHLLLRVRIVLVRPRGAANVGAAARAMKNMGLRDMVLVAPRFARPALAVTMAVHAREIVQGARTFATVGEAVADCQLVVGTTSRRGGYRGCRERLDEIASDLLEHAGNGAVALPFGPEDHGLTNADLVHCQRLLTIPSDEAYSSLNVAQAVLLCCYELRRAAVSQRTVVTKRPAAHAGDVDFMLRRLQQALLRIGFLHPDNPEHIMLAVRQLLGRTTLDEREVRILLGLARQIEWYARTHDPVDGERGRNDRV